MIEVVENMTVVADEHNRTTIENDKNSVSDNDDDDSDIGDGSVDQMRITLDLKIQDAQVIYCGDGFVLFFVKMYSILKALI